MNCERFKGLLQEYLDGGLSAQEQAAARQHIADCPACRLALTREQSFGASMRRALDEAVAGISVGPEIGQNIAEGSRVKPRGLAALWDSWVRSLPVPPTVACAVASVVFLLILGSTLGHRSTKSHFPENLAQDGKPNWVVDVPIDAQSYVFRRGLDKVVDCIADETGEGHQGSSGAGTR